MKRARPPRGLIVSTGEENPGGQSLRARLVICEIKKGDVDVEKLSIAQADAAEGLYAQAMAGFIQWLAPQIDAVKNQFRDMVRERRTEFKGHSRTADALAQIWHAWIIWLDFARAIGAIDDDEADAIVRGVVETLQTISEQQAELQRDNDPVERFFEILSSALSTGKAHITSAAFPDSRPDDAKDLHALGWRRKGTDWLPQGDCIGWWATDGIYLDSEASYRIANQGACVGVEAQTLWKRMHDKGRLIGTETSGGTRRLKVRKHIGGQRRRVVHVTNNIEAWYVRETGPSGPSGPRAEKRQQDHGVA